MLLVCTKRAAAGCSALFSRRSRSTRAACTIDHRIAQPGYVCLNCGSPALDLGEVPAEMAAEAEADEASSSTTDILCPVCETMVQVDEGMECPNCGAPLEVG